MSANDSLPPSPPAADDPLRSRYRVIALVALTAAGLLLCVLIAYPFLPALAWAVALAVMAFPVHDRLTRVLPNATWAAGVATALVVVILVVPVLLVGGQLAREAAGAKEKVDELSQPGRLEELADRVPNGRWAVDWARANVDVQAEARKLVERFAGDAAALANGSAWVAFQLLVCVFVLFYAFRDARHLLTGVSGLTPLARDEADFLFRQVSGSVYATVYATTLTSTLQGVTGGLLFWALGLPAPVLWGVVMTVLGILPILGGFLVWLPAAIYLVSVDRWGAAAILVAWGVVMAGPVCNFVYARLAGDRMRLHPVPVLVAYVGGLAVFGVSGMVLGPAILAVTVGLLDVWRRRLGAAEKPTLIHQ